MPEERERLEPWRFDAVTNAETWESGIEFEDDGSGFDLTRPSSYYRIEIWRRVPTHAPVLAIEKGDSAFAAEPLKLMWSIEHTLIEDFKPGTYDVSFTYQDAPGGLRKTILVGELPVKNGFVTKGVGP